MKIRATNPDLSKTQQTTLSTAVAAGATIAYVRNTSGLADNDYFQFGETGTEKAEIVKVTTVTSPGTLAVITALKFAHGVDTPVYKLMYNQVKFYRSTDSGSTYSLLATSDIQPDQPETIYEDTSGASTYYYKITYYNATTAVASGYSGALLATGYSTYALKSLQDEVLKLYPDRTGRYLKRPDITSWINDRYLSIQSSLKELNQGYFVKDNTASPDALAASTKGYTLPTDFSNLIRLEVAYDSTNYYRATFLDEREDEPTTTHSQNAPVYDFEDNKFNLRPVPSGVGTYKIWYSYWDELENLGDELNAAVRPFKAVFVWHALAMACYAGGKEDRGDRFMKRADNLETRLINRMGRRTQDGTRQVVISDSAFFDIEII